MAKDTETKTESNVAEETEATSSASMENLASQLDDYLQERRESRRKEAEETEGAEDTEESSGAEEESKKQDSPKGEEDDPPSAFLLRVAKRMGVPDYEIQGRSGTELNQYLIEVAQDAVDSDYRKKEPEPKASDTKEQEPDYSAFDSEVAKVLKSMGDAIKVSEKERNQLREKIEEMELRGRAREKNEALALANEWVNKQDQAVKEILQSREAREKWLNYTARLGTNREDRIDINELFDEAFHAAHGKALKNGSHKATGEGKPTPAKADGDGAKSKNGVGMKATPGLRTNIRNRAGDQGFENEVPSTSGDPRSFASEVAPLLEEHLRKLRRKGSS